LTLMQAYATPWIVPVYTMLESVTTAEVSTASKGFIYLLILAVALGLITLAVALANKKKV